LEQSPEIVRCENRGDKPHLRSNHRREIT
jgi:hypothetical protein